VCISPPLLGCWILSGFRKTNHLSSVFHVVVVSLLFFPFKVLVSVPPSRSSAFRPLFVTSPVPRRVSHLPPLPPRLGRVSYAPPALVEARGTLFFWIELPLPKLFPLFPFGACAAVLFAADLPLSIFFKSHQTPFVSANFPFPPYVLPTPAFPHSTEIAIIGTGLFFFTRLPSYLFFQGVSFSFFFVQVDRGPFFFFFSPFRNYSWCVVPPPSFP